MFFRIDIKPQLILAVMLNCSQYNDMAYFSINVVTAMSDIAFADSLSLELYQRYLAYVF